RGLRDAAYLVAKLPSVKVVIGDPNDDMVVACALKAKASYIVTRDEMILNLRKYKGVKIATPEELVEVLRKGRSS
ncbi:MAG: PIN domain-containing protein, partial [Nitrospirae bacterium]|nr:PIN domain-containing protein [Nitrospirota bacterium]